MGERENKTRNQMLIQTFKNVYVPIIFYDALPHGTMHQITLYDFASWIKKQITKMKKISMYYLYEVLVQKAIIIILWI